MNIYTRYHICLMRVFILLLSIRYVCVCHNPMYHYMIVDYFDTTSPAVSFREKSVKLPPCLLFFFYKKLKNVSCEYNRLNGWNTTLQAAWYIRRVRIIWFLWTKPTIWLLILSVRACSMFYPHEGYRSVTPLDAAGVNRTIFHNHSVHWYYITLKEGRDCIKHDIIIWHGQQNPHRGRWL